MDAEGTSAGSVSLMERCHLTEQMLRSYMHIAAYYGGEEKRGFPYEKGGRHGHRAKERDRRSCPSSTSRVWLRPPRIWTPWSRQLLQSHGVTGGPFMECMVLVSREVLRLAGCSGARGWVWFACRRFPDSSVCRSETGALFRAGIVVPDSC